MERFLQQYKVDTAVAPVALSANVAVTGGWRSMAHYAEAAFALLVGGALAAGAEIVLTILQAKDAAGTGAKALRELVVTGGAGARRLRAAFSGARRSTLTLASAIATDAVTLGSGDGAVTITFVADSPGANEIVIGGSDTLSATALAAAIDALEGWSASSSGAVVTVVGAANVTTADTTITIVPSAVADGDEVEVNGETLTFKKTGTGTEGAAAPGEVLLGATDAACLVNLLAALNALPGLVASSITGGGPIAEIVCDAPGGVSFDAGDTALAVTTVEAHAATGFDVESLDVNAGFSQLAAAVETDGSGVTAAVLCVRGASRKAVVN